MIDPRNRADEIEIARIQAALEDMFDRQVAAEPEARETELVQTLHAELASVPESARAGLVDALLALYPADAPAVSSPEEGAELSELRREIERLREQAEPRTVPGRPTGGGEALGEVLTVLLGRGGNEAAVAGDEGRARVTAVVQALVGFAEKLGRTYLAATADRDHTMAGRVQQTIRAELEGRQAGGTVADMLDTIADQVMLQLVAFRNACARGGGELLRELSPTAIEAEVNRTKGGALNSLFLHKNCWDLLSARYRDLQSAEGELYDRFFDRVFRAELYRLGQARGKGGRTDAR